jgi:hypothetical protein
MPDLSPVLIETFDAGRKLMAAAKTVLEKWFRQKRSDLFRSVHLWLSDIDRR